MSALQIIWDLNIAATAVLLLRIVFLRLTPVYPWLFGYLLADSVQQAARLMVTDLNRSAEIYMVGQAIKVVLAVFVVLEIYRIALERTPALAQYGRSTVGKVLGAAAVIAIIGLMLDPSVPPQQSRILFNFFSFERTMDIWVLVFLLLIIGFMSWFPVQMRRNLAIYISGFVLYFVARFVFLLAWMDTLQRDTNAASGDQLNTAVLSISLLSLLLWVFAFRKPGEEMTTVVGHRWNPEAMQRLAGQLESLNASLVRLSRRGRRD